MSPYLNYIRSLDDIAHARGLLKLISAQEIVERGVFDSSRLTVMMEGC